MRIGGSRLGSSLGRSYWRTPEVQLALAVYILMAALVLIILIGVGQSLRRFARLSHEIRTRPRHGASFAAQNRMPELAPVAAEFDRLVGTLRALLAVRADKGTDRGWLFVCPPVMRGRHALRVFALLVVPGVISCCAVAVTSAPPTRPVR